MRYIASYLALCVFLLTQMPAKTQPHNFIIEAQVTGDYEGPVKGFEIVGISLDKETRPWLDAIKNNGLNWIQVIDWHNGKFELRDRHNVAVIPYNILVDPKGMIVATSLRGNHLSIKLKELFAK